MGNQVPPSQSGRPPTLPSAVLERVDRMLRRFETARSAGSRPRVRDYLTELDTERRLLLRYLPRMDLEQRLEAGEAVGAAEYLAELPELAEDVAAAADLLAAELVVRQRRNEGPPLEDYLARFPRYADELIQRLEARRAGVAARPAQGPSPAEAETLRPAPASGPAGPPPEASDQLPPFITAIGPFGSPLGAALQEAVGPVTAPALPVSSMRDEPGPPAAGGELVRIAGYEVLGELGAGGMGVVYKARQTSLRRIVALKKVRSGECASADELRRFQAEAEAVAQLQHPNIVQVYEVGQHDGLPYFSLEFCAGGSLEKQLDGTPWGARRAATLVEVLAGAMQAAHRVGIIHRDLKPANVLLTADGTPKITDFGLVKRLDVPGHTQINAVMGTPPYMPPEQAGASGGRVGPTADVYSLGAILYELLTGRPPFKAATALETVLQVLSEEPVPVRRLQPKVPKDLETICHKCLEKEPRRRYASAAELADDLGRFGAGEPVAARPVGGAVRLHKWARRRPAVAGLLTLVAVVAGLGAAGIAWAYGEALRQRQAANDEADKTRQANASLEAVNATLKTTNSDLAEANTALKLEKRRAYITALNKRLGAGATAENNAAVLIWKALGPHPEGATMPPEVFRWMGIATPAENGEYFIPLGPYARDHLKVDLDSALAQLDRSAAHVWTAQDHPAIASWLKTNERPLALVLEATRRSHYFQPVVPGGRMALLGDSPLDSVHLCPELAKALAARALLRVGEGASEEAWQDLLACHRLGRLVGQGGSLMELLVGVALDNQAATADLAFLDRAKLDARRIENCLDGLHTLRAVPTMADRVTLTERFAFLELLTALEGEKNDHQGTFRGIFPAWQSLETVAAEAIDWDAAFNNANRWFDRLATAMRIPQRGSRIKELEQIETELKVLMSKLAEGDPNAAFLALNAGGKADAVIDALVAQMSPAVVKVQNAADRHQQVQDNLFLAFALAWYQREQGHYPQTLDALAPKYLRRVPQDLFSGKALVYRPAANGYLLCSVGPNGKDDEGRGPNDNPPGDDLSIRMPRPGR
jgi:aminoglycoside phosphotransferase (APT) family kinase protein